jgi:hypothetical protein
MEEQVFGPVLHEVGADPSALNMSMLEWWNAVVKGTLVRQPFSSHLSPLRSHPSCPLFPTHHSPYFHRGPVHTTSN